MFNSTSASSSILSNQALAMNEKGITSDQRSASLYPMLFGVSWAHSLNQTDEMLHAAATLMCLLLWRVQTEEQVKCEFQNKLQNAETKIKDLKTRRTEDAKANEKVVSIFAAHEQRWLMERKKLTRQLRLLFNELQVNNAKREENALKLNGHLQEKDKLLEEEKRKRRDREETIKRAEKLNQELIETLKHEAQEHSKEIWKHKSAFIELVSTQRQLEAEMGRAVRQVEAEKQALDAVLAQKQQYVLMTQHLSMELIKTRKDLEQKNKILSAMLGKSILDTAEKQMLTKRIKMSKGKRQQAALQSENSKSRNERYSLRNMLSRHQRSKPQAVPSQTRSQSNNRHEHDQSDFNEEQDVSLQQSITEAREHNLQVEAVLLDREAELHALKVQMESELHLRTQTIIHDQKVLFEEISEEIVFNDTVLTVQSPDKEFEDMKDAYLDPISVEECGSKDIQNAELSTWKMDLHALGVFYKIQRLKQQILMFERLSGKQEICENCKCDDKRQFYNLISLITKQVSRCQSLQDKANDICKRMYENDQDASSGSSVTGKSKKETKILKHFLEETFQLQRYTVATGQKLIDIQSKIACGFVGVPDDQFNRASVSFDMKKFADCLQTLFMEVQKGLEARISQIIGDLAWDGMIHPRN